MKRQIFGDALKQTFYMIWELVLRDTEYLKTKSSLESGLNHYWSEVNDWLNGEQNNPQESPGYNAHLHTVYQPAFHHDTDRT